MVLIGLDYFSYAVKRKYKTRRCIGICYENTAVKIEIILNAYREIRSQRNNLCIYIVKIGKYLIKTVCNIGKSRSVLTESHK